MVVAMIHKQTNNNKQNKNIFNLAHYINKIVNYIKLIIKTLTFSVCTGEPHKGLIKKNSDQAWLPSLKKWGLKQKLDSDINKIYV